MFIYSFKLDVSFKWSLSSSMPNVTYLHVISRTAYIFLQIAEMPKPIHDNNNNKIIK